MKTLVIYYSLTGKTGVVAQSLSRALDADLRRIEDVDPPKATWWFMLRGGFAALRGRTSPIRPVDVRLPDYDRVFVGSPVWAGSPSTPINAFLTKADFGGAQVVTFMTLGGNDSAAALGKMKERIEARDGAVIDGFALSSGKATDDELATQALAFARRFQ